MFQTVDLRGKYYEFRRCLVSDIYDHFLRVKEFIEPAEYEVFKERMLTSCELGTAFMLADNSCYLYYINSKPCCATGVAMLGKNVPMKMMALLSGIFRSIDNTTFKIDFYLHTNKFVREYKSILTDTSIKRHIDNNYPLVIRVDKLREKINKLAVKEI